MKRIGYIYKYSEIEKKGILVYNDMGNKDNIVNLFSEQDCKKKVGTGQLVYFHIDNGIISNIERATLSSFDKIVMNDIITWKKGYYSSWYQFNTNISLYKLDNKLSSEISRRKEQEEVEEDDEFGLFNFNLDDLFDDCFSEWQFSSNNYETQEVGQTRNIDELFEYFGKDQLLYESFIGNDDISSVNILDISLWIDKEICKHKCFGEKAEELKYLYNIFIEKKRIDEKGDIITTERKNDCISKTWKLLLAKSPDQELRIIAQEMPIFQPVLPIKFCKKHLDILSEQYGMPNVAICQLYCMHKIENTNTASEYEYLSNRLYVYEHCETEHLKGEGVPFCKMGRKKIKGLSEQLEERYNTIIINNITQQFLLFTSKKGKDYLKKKNYSKEQILSIGEFMDYLKKCLEEIDYIGYGVYRDDFMEKYADMPHECQILLKNKTHECINKAIIVEAKDEYTSPYHLGEFIKKYSGWIDDSIKSEITHLVNFRFANLDDLSELFDAYKYRFITQMQYCRRYKHLIFDFKIHELVTELRNYHYYESKQLIPLSIQWLVISRIISYFNFVSLDSSDYVTLGYVGVITDIRSLLKWIHDVPLYKIVRNKTEQRIIQKLNNEDKWILFEEGLISSPGKKLIRERLDNAYKSKSFRGTYFQKEFVQKMMYKDFFTCNDLNIRMLIADQLESNYQKLILNQIDGFLKLYLWQKQPSENFDWELIKTHFYELSAEAQIKMLRFIFGKIALGVLSLSFDDLYSEFVETTAPACSAICGILHILKVKKNDLNVSITPSMIESVIGEEQTQRIDFLKDSKELFYPCNGYLAISANQSNIEYQSFNGFLTKEIKNYELYYVIKFYHSPVNLFGRVIEWLDSEEVEIAVQMLLRNSSVVEIDGKYYIHETHEFFVKQFVIAYDIDDKCGLVSDKERMIELGYLPRNNAYQPLYTNHLRKYEEADNYICRGGCFGDSDPNNNSIPFFWCKKKMCVRRAHFLLPPCKWEDYRFADLLYIVLGQSPNVRESVWQVNSEISQFVCDYLHILKSNERNICSKPLNELEERGIWDKKSSIYRNIYDGDDDEYEDDD